MRMGLGDEREESGPQKANDVDQWFGALGMKKGVGEEYSSWSGHLNKSPSVQKVVRLRTHLFLNSVLVVFK